MTTVHLCSFASAIGEMKQRDRRSPAKVLAVLKAKPKFSCFDASANQHIAGTLDLLKREGFIEYPQPQPGYPWNKVVITAKGEEFLKKEQQK